MSQQDKYSILSRESEVDIIRKVILTMNEQKKYEVIKKLVDTSGNKDRAAIELGCTRRTVDRLIKAYRERGKAAFSHGNKGRSPAHTKPDVIRQQIPLLYENKYFDTNIRHFTELLEKVVAGHCIRFQNTGAFCRSIFWDLTFQLDFCDKSITTSIKIICHFVEVMVTRI